MYKRFLISFLFCFSIHTLWSEVDLIDQINAQRLSEGLNVLIEEEYLHITAESYVSTLERTGLLSHEDAMGQRVLDRYRQIGGTAGRAGEILGTSISLSEIYSAWFNSPEHKKVILNPLWKRIGQGIIKKDSQYIAVVLFSNSIIDNYQVYYENDFVQVQIEPIEGYSINLFGDYIETIDQSMYRIEGNDLPRLLFINGGSDFLYLSEKFFDRKD